MAKITDIKALFKAMAEHGIDECEIDTSEEKITVRRRPNRQESPVAPHE